VDLTVVRASFNTSAHRAHIGPRVRGRIAGSRCAHRSSVHGSLHRGMLVLLVSLR
jgi:hypothetical protein